MKACFDFVGSHVFVFGGTTGINLGIARSFAEAGATVTVASRKQENIDTAVRSLQTLGGRAQGVMADVRDFAAVGRAFETACAAFGEIDVLVSGAAGNFLAEANQLSANGFKVVVDIDLIGTFNVMRQGYAHLRKPGACAINISAPQSTIPIRSQIHACAAKAGIDQITRVLAMEWGRNGVRVNAISPGAIEGTEGMKRLLPPGKDGMATVIKGIPLGRVGTTTDIASLAMFLASEQGSYISGAIIPCDGGGALDSVKTMIEIAAQLQRETTGS